jgi:hypothetical protein
LESRRLTPGGTLVLLDGDILYFGEGKWVGSNELCWTKQGYSWNDLRLEVKLDVDPKDEERTRVLLLKAKRNCIIANTLKAEVQLRATINGVNEQDAEMRLDMGRIGMSK